MEESSRKELDEEGDPDRGKSSCGEDDVDLGKLGCISKLDIRGPWLEGT